MKIIKKGRCWFDGHKVTCEKCKAELELEEKDSVTITFKPHKNWFEIKCPTGGCGNILHFKENW